MSNRQTVGGPGLTIGALVASALFLAAGLIFMCAVVDNPRRLPISLALLLVGVALAAGAGRRWRRARQLSPDVLDDRIVELAAGYDAEVTLAQVVSSLGVPDDAARTALAHLEAKGLAHQEHREGKTIYLFPGLKDSQVVRRCAYCGSEYSVREPLHKCPNCGGQLEITKK
jgi:hypothetical protein